MSSYAQHFAHLKAIFSKVMALHQIDYVAIYSGASQGQFMDDMYYPFVSNPFFNYWYPLSVPPHSWIIIDAEQNVKLKFYSPADFWHKVETLPDDERLSHFNIEVISTPGKLSDWCSSNQLGLVIGEHTEKVLGDVNIKLNDEAALNHLAWERAYKTDYEKEQIRHANALAIKGHKAAEKAFREGLSEFDINMAYLQASRQSEQSCPYGNIVALNENAAILHYTVYDKERDNQRTKQSFLIDAGAKASHYCSDITRTYSFNTNDEFAQLIEQMDQMQLQLVKHLTAGSRYADLHVQCHKNLLDILVDAEIVIGSKELAWERGVTQTFFPHGLGHFLGLQVHDLGGHQQSQAGGRVSPPSQYPFLRCTRMIEPDQVFTIEPGLYFIPALLNTLKESHAASSVNWDKVNFYKPYGGIRIEDNIIVNNVGNENVTRNAW